MPRFIFLLVFLFAGAMVAEAQYYKGGVGLRFGYGIGASVKVGFKNDNYFELISTYGALGPGTEFCALYEHHFELNRVDGLAIFLGVGPGFVLRPNTKNYPNDRFAAGLDPIMGFDYTLTRAPVNFSFDFKPRLQWRGGVFEYVPDFGFTCRYVWGT